MEKGKKEYSLKELVKGITLQNRHSEVAFGGSDRLFRAARIFALAADVLESKENARKWMHSPQLSLGGKVPSDLLSTEAGTEKVENLLIRIEYGVIS